MENDTRFGITTLGMAGPCIEISSEEFYRSKSAKRRLAAALVVEDKFDLVLANYEELERDLLGLATYEMIYSEFSWASYRLDAQTVNRRVLNLLSAGRLYIDHIIHDAAEFGEDMRMIERLREKAAEQYDTKLGYRVMEALRNYTQHRSLPVHGLEYQREWVPPDRFENMMYTVILSISVERLREDKRVKASVIAELGQIGLNVPLTPLIREYVEGISIIQGEFRDCIRSDIKSAEETFGSTLDRAAKAFNRKPEAVQIVAIDRAGNYSDHDHIFEELITHRNTLATKNQVLTNLPRRFVSGISSLTRGK
jgi:hypothetical protein